ncbi:hypothetical protein BV25DRAFT_1828564 [Artomyces pyxidatus]|uniref:Uncharacterized protein n=1 Tax=Artomyces pyxidatus TaxID=48021 RepID=A0ACB8STC7_9AGAM|nr:hypothetical protein BV25DRAFT_1828564 [Artomyces pyxidatus]
MIHVPEAFNSSLQADEPRLAIERNQNLEGQAASASEITLSHWSYASAPIAILFPEILVRIFEDLALIDPPRNDRRRNNYSIGWISYTTHVCRYWRQVSLAHPTLWAEISFVLGSKWTREMITRAKTVPLSFIWELRNGHHPMDPINPRELAGIVTAEFARTRELYVAGPRALDSFFSSFLSLPAPILETLSLHGNSSGIVNAPPVRQRSIPSTFFQGKDSRLRKISILDVSCPWTSVPTASLTSLKICFLSSLSRPIPMVPHALDQFLDFLESTPTLEELDLRHSLPYNASPHASVDRVVRSQHLRRVKLMGSHTAIANVLRHIDTAALLYLRLDLTVDAHPPHTFPNTRSPGPIPPHLFPVLETLAVFDKRNGSRDDFVLLSPAPNLKTFQLRNSHRVSNREGASLVPPKFVGNEYPTIQEFTLDGFQFSMDSFPLATLTHLDLILPSNSCTLITFDDFLDRLAATAPTLQVLSLVHCFLPRDIIGSAPRTSGRIIPLPRLTKLSLHETSGIVAAFLLHVELPVTAKLDISCTKLDSSSTLTGDPAFALPFSAVDHNRNIFTCSLRMSHGLPGDGHRLSATGRMDTHIRAMPPFEERPFFHGDGDHIFVELRIPVTQRPLLPNILSPAIHIQSLFIDNQWGSGYWHLIEADWRDVFRHCHTIQHLDIMECGTRRSVQDQMGTITILRALTAEEYEGKQEDKDVILPILTSLCLTYTGHLLGEGGEWLRLPLISILRRRRVDTDTRLQYLHIQSYESAEESSASLALFDEIADEVYWHPDLLF